jgi:hypothetical protein
LRIRSVWSKTDYKNTSRNLMQPVKTINILKYHFLHCESCPRYRCLLAQVLL